MSGDKSNPLKNIGREENCNGKENRIKHVRIIINPASGKEEPILPIINSSMKDAGIKWEASITHKAGDAIQSAKAAVKERIDPLAVYGDDGTLKEGISGLIGSEIPLIILPGGSANVMAKELGIPKDLRGACGLIGQVPSKLKTIDVGQFDKHIDVSDGFLDVVVVRKANLSLFKLMVVTLLKRERPDNLELVEHWQGKDISVSSTPKQTVQCDGEVLEKRKVIE